MGHDDVSVADVPQTLKHSRPATTKETSFTGVLLCGVLYDEPRFKNTWLIEYETGPMDCIQ